MSITVSPAQLLDCSGSLQTSIPHQGLGVEQSAEPVAPAPEILLVTSSGATAARQPERCAGLCGAASHMPMPARTPKLMAGKVEKWELGRQRPAPKTPCWAELATSPIQQKPCKPPWRRGANLQSE